MEVMVGSWVFFGVIFFCDVYVVKKLCEVGVVLFGKNMCSEWVDMRSNDYLEGYLVRGG